MNSFNRKKNSDGKKVENTQLVEFIGATVDPFTNPSIHFKIKKSDGKKFRKHPPC